MTARPDNNALNGVICLSAIMLGIAINAAALWWLIVSIVDFRAGAEPTVWNLLGIILPTLVLLSTVASATTVRSNR